MSADFIGGAVNAVGGPAIDALAAKGYRVLGLASRVPVEGRDMVDMADIKDLTLLGVLGMIDPPRESAK